MEKAALKIEDTSAAFYIVRLLAFQPFIHRSSTFNTTPTANGIPFQNHNRIDTGCRQLLVTEKMKPQHKQYGNPFELQRSIFPHHIYLNCHKDNEFKANNNVYQVFIRIFAQD